MDGPTFAPAATGYDIHVQHMVLDELRRSYDRRHASIDSLNTSLWTLFGATAVIITLAAAVRVLAVQARTGTWFWPLVAAAALLYGGQLAAILYAMRPLRFVFPMSWAWSDLAEWYFPKPEGQALDQLISDYGRALEALTPVNRSKSLALKISLWLFAGVVLITVIGLGLSV